MRFETCRTRQKPNESINLKRVHFVALCCVIIYRVSCSLESGNRGTFVYRVTWLRSGRQGSVDRFPAETVAFCVFEASTPTIKPMHPSLQWVAVAVLPGAKQLGREAQGYRERIWVPVGGGKRKRSR